MLQEFVKQIQKNTEDAIRGIHTAMPGTVISFDPSTGLASVQPIMKFKKPDGATMDYPKLTGVPVVFPQALGQQATMAFPVKPGDGCLIIIAEQSIDYWLFGQETDTDLAFDLTNAVCIPGMFVSANGVVQEACARNAIIVDVKSTRMEIGKGYIEITSPEIRMSGNLTVEGNVISHGSASITGNISAGGSAAISGSTSVGGDVNVGGDVTAGSISLQEHKHRDGDNEITSAPL